MHKIKLLIMLIVGACIGYLIANYSSSTINEEAIAAQAKITPTLHQKAIGVSANVSNYDLDTEDGVNPQFEAPDFTRSTIQQNVTKSESNISKQELEDKYRQLKKAHQSSLNKV